MLPFNTQNKQFKQNRVNYLLFTTGIIFAYVSAALLGFEFASINGNVSLIWIPAGIALAAIIYLGVNYWPAVLIGAFIANLLTGSTYLTAIGIASGNTAEALIAFWIIRYYFKSRLNAFDNPQHILLFILAVACGALVAAVNGATVLALLSDNGQPFFNTMSIWWFGDVVSMLLITPSILIWLQPPHKYPVKLLIKNLFFLSIVFVSLLISFGDLIQSFNDSVFLQTQYPLAFIPMAALLVLAMVSGPKLISLAILISTTFIFVATLSSHGPFARSSFEESFALIYLFISISAFSAYGLSYLIRQRNKAEEALRIGSDRLDYVMQGTEDGVWDWNIETAEVYVSTTLKKMLGYNKDELLGDLAQWQDRLHPDDKEKTLGLLNDHFINEAESFQSEFRLRCKNKDYLWVLGRGKSVKRDENGYAIRMVGTCVSLLQQKKKQAKLELAAKVVQNTPDAIMVTSAENIILDINPAFSKITGYTRNEVIGRKSSMLSSGRHDKAFYKKMWDSISDVGHWQGEIWNRRKNGEVFPEWIHITAIKSLDGSVVQYVALFSDIAHQEHLKKELHNFAYYDALTSLPNRELFIDRLNISLHQASQNRPMENRPMENQPMENQTNKNTQQMAVLLIDLDRFKVINETLGHSVGDALLQEVSRILSTSLKEGDTVARMGGDEFAILLPAINSLEEVTMLIEQILQQFTSPCVIQEHELYITCSAGITVYPQDGVTAEELIKNADTSMYKAKELGFNKYQFYHADMSALFHERFQLENHLRYAVSKDELYLEYQPQHDINDGSIIGMEALVRWSHADLGTVAPYKFIPVAEDTGLIVSIGEWILKRAIEDASRIQKKVSADFRVAVNLSVLQIQQSHFVEFVNDTLIQAGLPPHHLELEITESILMKNIDETLRTLSELSELGIKIAIDDFGTGYSSLSYLKKFPISKLKIDKSFVDDVCVSSDDAEIASTIIAMGHNLHMKVIAEGVEDADQQAFLQSRGCDEVQGYLYSRPLKFEQFVIYLHNYKAQTPVKAYSGLEKISHITDKIFKQ